MCCSILLFFCILPKSCGRLAGWLQQGTERGIGIYRKLFKHIINSICFSARVIKCDTWSYAQRDHMHSMTICTPARTNIVGISSRSEIGDVLTNSSILYRSVVTEKFTSLRHL